MKNQLVPEQLLQNADKILFITHLAIGDYTYMQTYFKAFAERYPNIKVDVWVDEVRRTRCFWRWDGLKKYSLYDWLKACPFFNKVYDETYSPGVFKKSIEQAQKENYPIVVSLGALRAHNYADLARTIAPRGFVVGIEHPLKPMNFLKKRKYKKLNAVLNLDTQKDYKGIHITDAYAAWFEKLFGLKVEPLKRAPFVTIPSKWILYAKLQFLKRGIDRKTNKFGRVFFINPFAKDKKRCWPMERVAELISCIKHDDAWRDISFIVNVVPEEFERVNTFFKERSLNDVFLFTANVNFFQLPAIMSCCDMIISVETSTIHLASALHVPVVALMRQKNPEWAPWDKENSCIVTTEKRVQWVKDIPTVSIMHAVKDFSKNFYAKKY